MDTVLRFGRWDDYPLRPSARYPKKDRQDREFSSVGKRKDDRRDHK